MIAFLFVLVVVGACLWLVERYVPMDYPFRVVIRVVVVLALVWYLLSLVGLVPTTVRPL